MVEYKSKSKTAFTLFNYLLMIFVSLICVLPFLNLLAISFSGSAPVAAGEVRFIPIDFTFSSYEFAIKGGKFFTALLISLKRVVIGTSINILLCIITAYPLSKGKEKLVGRNWYMFFFVITMLINGGLIPTYLVVVKAKLINSIWALILPGALPVFNMVILMNFIRGLPEELEEAALIDGANYMVVLIKVLLPVLKPAIATIGLFSIVGHWNDWFGGIIYMNDTAKYPLQSYLQTLLQSFETIMMKSGTDYTKLLAMMNARTGRAAQLFLGAIPVMLIYPFLQKYFTKGLVLGSVKG